MNVWKCKLIFLTDTLQQKIKITDLKPFLAGENTSVLIILATTVNIACLFFFFSWSRILRKENPVTQIIIVFSFLLNVS